MEKQIPNRLVQRNSGDSAKATYVRELRRGIVLLEAVVAIGILSLIVSALFVLASRTNTAIYAAADQVVATYLTLDASEWLRGRKIYNELNGLPWDDGISCSSGPCGVNTQHPNMEFNDVTPCSDAAMNACTLNLVGSLYQHSNFGSPSHFSRTIEADSRDLDTPADGDIDVTDYAITVTWRGGGGVTQSSTMYTSLYKTENP